MFATTWINRFAWIAAAVFVIGCVPSAMVLSDSANTWLTPAPEYNVYVFSGAFCPACRAQAANWEAADIAGLLKKQGITYFNIDTAKELTLTQQWGVKIIPTTIMVEVMPSGKSARAVRRFNAMMSESQLKDFVNLNATPPISN